MAYCIRILTYALLCMSVFSMRVNSQQNPSIFDQSISGYKVEIIETKNRKLKLSLTTRRIGTLKGCKLECDIQEINGIVYLSSRFKDCFPMRLDAIGDRSYGDCFVIPPSDSFHLCLI